MFGHHAGNLRHIFTFAQLVLRKAIIRIKGAAFAKLQDDVHAWNPVRLFAVDQVPQNVVRAESVLAFVGVLPVFGQVGKPLAQHAGRSGKDAQGIGQGELDHVGDFYTNLKQKVF